MPAKPVKEPIFTTSVECPIKITYTHGVSSPLGSPTYHEETEIQYIKRGEGAYIVGDCSYPFRKNSLLLIKPDEIHRLHMLPDSYLEKYSFCFKADFLAGDISLLELPEDFPHLLELSEREATEVEVAIKGIVGEKEAAQPCWLEIIRRDLARIILLIRRAALTRNARRPMESPIINAILAHVEAGFAENMTLTNTADRFGISAGYLSRLFKSCTGLNFKRFVIQRQIAEAKRLLLEEPDRKVSAVASDVGLPDFALFNRNFKQITGLTPSNYRKILHQQVK